MISSVFMTVFNFFLSLLSQAHSKLATCQTCKTLIKTGEVLHGLGVGGVMGSYCSVNCLNKGKLTTASFVGKQPDDTVVLLLQRLFVCVAVHLFQASVCLRPCSDSEIFNQISQLVIVELSQVNRFVYF